MRLTSKLTNISTEDDRSCGRDPVGNVSSQISRHDLDKIGSLDRKSLISAQHNDPSLQKVLAEAISPEEVDDLTRPCFLMENCVIFY